MLNKFLDNNKEQLYALFRIIVGFLLLLHGATKFGLIGGGNSVPLISLMGLAATIELLGGLAILLGFYTQTAAVLGGLVMLFALFIVSPSGELFAGHFAGGWNPLKNGGELALLFLAAFFNIAIHGPGIWSVDKKGR